MLVILPQIEIGLQRFEQRQQADRVLGFHFLDGLETMAFSAVCRNSVLGVSCENP
jgi:hypothetical protein